MASVTLHPAFPTLLWLLHTSSVATAAFQWCGRDAVEAPETMVFYENKRGIETCCVGDTTTRLKESEMAVDFRYFGPAHDYLGGYVYWMTFNPYKLQRHNYVTGETETVANIPEDDFPQKQEENKKAFTFDPIYKVVYFISHKSGRGGQTSDCQNSFTGCQGNGLYKIDISTWSSGDSPLDATSIVRLRYEYRDYMGGVFDPLMEGNSQFTELQTDCDGNLLVADKGSYFKGVYRLPRGFNSTTMAEWVFYPTLSVGSRFMESGFDRPKSMIFDGVDSLYFVRKRDSLYEPESIYRLRLVQDLGASTKATHTGQTRVRICSLQTDCTLPGFPDSDAASIMENTVTKWDDERLTLVYKSVYYEILPTKGAGTTMYLFGISIDPVNRILYVMGAKQNYGARSLFALEATPRSG
jgi:hypothetical protein